MTDLTDTAPLETYRRMHYTWPLALVLFGIGALVMLVAYSDAAIALLALWWDSWEFGHGILLPIVIAYIIWLDHERFARHTPRIWFPGLIAVALCVLIWLTGRAVGVLVGEQTAMMLMFPALALVLLGPRATWGIAFLLFYPFVASPLWWLLNSTLQEVTAAATTWLVRAFEIPVYREGNYLTIAYGRFEVAEVCSGLRYLLASISLAGFFAYLNIPSIKRSAVMLCASVVAAVIANWIRVSGIVVLGHVSEMQHPMINKHDTFGWVVFCLAMIPLVMFGYRLGRGATSSPTGATTSAEKAVVGEARSVVAFSPLVGAAALAACVALVWLGPLLAGGSPLPIAAVQQLSTDLVADLEVPGWQRSAQPASGWKPHVAGVDSEQMVVFERDGEVVEFYLGVFAGQRQGAEVINDENRPFARGHYDTTGQHREGATLQVSDALVMRQTVFRERRDGARATAQVMLYGERIAGTFNDGDVSGKLRQFKVMLGAPPVAMVFAVGTYVEPNLELAQHRLVDFMRAALPQLEGTLTRLEEVTQ